LGDDTKVQNKFKFAWGQTCSQNQFNDGARCIKLPVAPVAAAVEENFS
jgi:hypothetical protein